MTENQTSKQKKLNSVQANELDRLIVDTARGDKQSFAVLYSKTQAAVYGLALSYLRSPADAEDVSQDVFVQIWNGAERFQAAGHAMAWIMTITRNMALERLRRNARFVDIDEEQWQQMPCEMPDVSTEDKVLLHTVLCRLSFEEQQIVNLHAVAGLKHREIAELLKIALPTELSKYHRALKKLKGFLEGEKSV